MESSQEYPSIVQRQLAESKADIAAITSEAQLASFRCHPTAQCISLSCLQGSMRCGFSLNGLGGARNWTQFGNIRDLYSYLERKQDLRLGKLVKIRDWNIKAP